MVEQEQIMRKVEQQIAEKVIGNKKQKTEKRKTTWDMAAGGRTNYGKSKKISGRNEQNTNKQYEWKNLIN